MRRTTATWECLNGFYIQLRSSWYDRAKNKLNWGFVWARNEIETWRNTKYCCMLQTNYSTKISPYFSMGYNFKCHKNTFYRLTMHPPVWKSKNISGQIVLSRPPWPVFLMNFPLNPPWECKQLRDAGGHPEYILRFQQTAGGYLRTWKKKKHKMNHF